MSTPIRAAYPRPMRRILLRTAAAAAAGSMAMLMAVAAPAAASPPNFELSCDRLAAVFVCEVRPVDPNLALISWHIDGRRRHAFDQQTVVPPIDWRSTRFRCLAVAQ
jgi:hypothetical protein